MTTGAEQGEIAEVGTPVSVPADPVDTHAPWRWTTIVLAVASVLLALTNAPAIVEWLDERPPSVATERLRPAIEGWRALTRSAGLEAPRDTLRGWWKAAQAARFGDEHPGEQGSDAAN